MLGDALQDPAGPDRYDWTRFRLIEEENSKLRADVEQLLEALKGVVRVADRKTVEFDAARAAIAKATGAA